MTDGGARPGYSLASSITIKATIKCAPLALSRWDSAQEGTRPLCSGYPCIILDDLWTIWRILSLRLDDYSVCLKLPLNSI